MATRKHISLQWWMLALGKRASMPQDALQGCVPETTVVHLDCNIHEKSSPPVLQQA